MHEKHIIEIEEAKKEFDNFVKQRENIAVELHEATNKLKKISHESNEIDVKKFIIII